MLSVHGRLAGHRGEPGAWGSGRYRSVSGPDDDLFDHLLLHDDLFDDLYLFDDFSINRDFFDDLSNDFFLDDYLLFNGYFLDDFPLDNNLFLYHSWRGRGSAAGNGQ